MRPNPSIPGSLAAAYLVCRRGVLRLFYLLVLLTFILVAKPARAHPDQGQPHGAHPPIRIAPHGWGNTTLADLQQVLDAVAEVIASHFPERQLGAIRVVPGEGGPMAFYDKGSDGEYVIQLSARHSRWHQFVYQFSHELCHVYSNFDEKPPTHDGQVENRNQWFEESVCEAAALYTLNELATRWERQPPAPQFAGYDATLKALLAYLVNEPHRQLASSTSLASWFRTNHATLETDPYLRDKNEVIANRLLPLFEQTPDALGAIGFLNAHADDAGKRFGDYLAAWLDACPERHRKVVLDIMAMFGQTRPNTALALASPAAPPVAIQRRD